MAIKHVGFTEDNKKVVVAYRTLPGDPYSALVVPTASLSQTYHDELFSVVDSVQGQDAYELATILAIRKFSDGGSMLGSLHASGKLKKVSTNAVTMTPGPQKESWLKLDELNKIIAEQRGVGIDELAIDETGKPGKTASVSTAQSTDGVLSDEDLAAQYRSQADTLYKEVQELRKKADDLAPKKSTAKKTANADA
jgi:hypothetical protein